MLDEESRLPGLSGYYEVLYDEASPKSEDTTLHLYFGPEEFLAAVSLEILLAALGIEDYELTEETLERKDYLEAYKKYYTSFFITQNIEIVPSWEKEDKLSSPLQICLDPGLAFGTGKHPTTQLCLAFLEEHPPKDMRVIDAGCGSGILTIGSLLLGATEVLAFDIDANAVHSTKANLDLNRKRLNGSYMVRKGGFDLPELLSYPADLLIGNLTASILVQHSKRLSDSRAQSLLLSGIIQEQEDFVRQEIEQDWKLLDRQERDGWLLLFLERK